MFAEVPTTSETVQPDILLFLSVWLAMAFVGGLAVWAMRCWLPAARGPLFALQRQRAVPWGPAELGVALLLCLLEGQFVAWVLGFRDFAGSVKTRELLLAEKELWTALMARPLQFVTLIVSLRMLCGAELYQFGLSLHRWVKDLIAAYGLWLVITPAAYLVFAFLLTAEPAKPHAWEELLKPDSGVSIWLAAGLVSVVFAPLAEELLFRGIAQPWLIRFPLAADLVVVAFLLLVVVMGTGQAGIWPAVLLIAGGCGYLLIDLAARRWFSRPGVARAVFATSILFTAIHPWPSPIPLFILSLGLGFLSYRTQSLVGPIVVHALFNLVSVLALAIAK